MKTLTATTLDKKEITLELRSPKEIGARPNIFVSAEVFAQYKADAENYDRATAIAEYQEIKEIALMSGQINVARKAVTDIARLRMLERTVIPAGTAPPTDEEIGPIPYESPYEKRLREEENNSFNEFFKDNVKEGMEDLNRENARVDSARREKESAIATELAMAKKEAEAKRKEEAEEQDEDEKTARRKIAEIRGNAKAARENFDRDTAYASLEELRVTSSLRGCLDLARLSIYGKCEICDLPSLHQRKFTKPPAQQRDEAEKSAREKRIDIAEKDAALAWNEAEFAWLQKQAAQKNGSPHETQSAWAKAEQEAAKRGRQAEERLAEEGVEEDWIEEADYSWIKKTVVDEIAFKFSSEKIEHFVKTYPCHEEESGLIRDRLVKEELRKVHAYAAQQKRQGSKKNFEITPALARNIFVLLFDYKYLKKKHPSIKETPEEEAQTNALFAPYLVPSNHHDPP